ncbi:sensor histidine kinase [Thermoflexibacter ruber]|uniref:histidine kinase n=1 Tax=Thermoflexibacter ruber TaxID=1003 RepID=A0A1I2FGS4_9BACT|nr:ATP-binding protein [Thermoflexibacter ruber]SFF03726.1 Histidine kinase-, DNA gyrase B-, and HSP90-like ATPase [Thermoflexibacter ruber]
MQVPTNIDEIKQQIEKEVAPKVGKVLGIEKFSWKNFRFNIMARVAGLTASIFGFSALWGEAGYNITTLGLGALIVFQVIGLIKHVESANREVVDFLNNIRYDDFSKTYKLNGEGKSFAELNTAFNEVIGRFRQIRAEKEANYQYLKTIIHHIGIGIISFDQNGNVQIINNAAKRLFKINQLANVENLRGFSSELVEKLWNLRTGTRDLVKIYTSDEIIQLAIYAIELTLREEHYKLITLQNIHTELEEQEMEAWQKLIRVLTHEIMNSVTPISSLAATVEAEIACLKENVEKGISMEDLDDMQMAIQTIQRRSEGLIRFVSDFRNLTHVPVPKFKNVKVAEIFNHISLLMSSEMEANQIKFEAFVEPDTLIITADQEMIEQVLINLIKNAIQALNECERKSNKQIILFAKQDEKSRPFIVVRDNGPGIDKDAIDRIFIPFFTTKKTGSGIGLSLSRQIMRQHKGSITAHSEVNLGTDFILKF